MGRDLKAFIWSFSLHAMVIVALFVLSHRMTYSRPILIDFSIEESIEGMKEGAKTSSPAQRPDKVRKEEKRIEPQEPIKEIVKQSTEAFQESPVTEASSEEQVSVPVTPQVSSSINEKGLENGSNLSALSKVVTSGINRAVETVSPGSTVDSAERARERYIKEHFAYIRDIITKNISYPFMARKMGWSGRVTISFIIIEDGSVKDIKIVESSGFDILDRNAAETVKKVSPFPRPPVRAEVIVPVVYRLN
ncbi:MAG: energy transducer TonB [Thermodesulfovibrionales bacterium]